MNKDMDKIILAPENLEQLKVAIGIPVPDPPNPKNKIDLNMLPEIVQIAIPSIPNLTHVKPLILSCDDGGKIAIMDKPHPHALFELMIMQADREPKAGINDIPWAQYRLLLYCANQFANFIENDAVIHNFHLEGGLPRISFNYNPSNQDREGLQPIRRLHLHAYILSSNTLETIRRKSIMYKFLPSSYARRRLVDPITFLGAQLVSDIHDSFFSSLPDLEIIRPDPRATVSQGLPIGLNIVLKKDWAALTDHAFAVYLRKLHCALNDACNNLYYAFTDKGCIAPHGTRHLLLEKAEIFRRLDRISWLSDISRSGLKEMASWLRNAPPKLITPLPQHNRLAIHHVILNGLAYTIGFTPNDLLGKYMHSRKVLMNISVRMFSNVGGAGLFGCEGITAVMLDRGKGMLSDKEMGDRWDFQRMFQTEIIKPFSLHEVNSSTLSNDSLQ